MQSPLSLVIWLPYAIDIAVPSSVDINHVNGEAAVPWLYAAKGECNTDVPQKQMYMDVFFSYLDLRAHISSASFVEHTILANSRPHCLLLYMYVIISDARF